MNQKRSVVVVYTGEGKGKTSAAIGLAVRALGSGRSVAFVQFVKSWEVSEHRFFAKIDEIYPERFTFYRGGKGFVKLGEHSARDRETGTKISLAEHKMAAQATLEFAKKCATADKYDVVICDEINVAVQQGLVSPDQMRELIISRNPSTSLCLTGRDWPNILDDEADIITSMDKVKHHFDDGFIANVGIDY